MLTAELEEAPPPKPNEPHHALLLLLPPLDNPVEELPLVPQPVYEFQNAPELAPEAVPALPDEALELSPAK